MHNGKEVKNHAKVFLVKAVGTPKPKSEIKYVAFWKPGSNSHLSGRTKKVIEKYLTEYKK